MFFSIIVPAYNIDNHIKKCLNSIKKQNFKDFEVIIIDDGSIDKTGYICDEFAKNDKRIKVIHQNNKGLSAARNTGISIAKGKYLVFVDGDDYIEKKSLRKFRECIIKKRYPDILITRIKQVYSNFIKFMDKDLSSFTLNKKIDYIYWIFSKSNNTWPSVRYVVKRNLIEKNNLKFAEGFLHEDVDWTFNLFLNAKSFSVSYFYWYNHQKIREGSITSNISGQNIIDIIKIVKKNIKIIQEVNLCEEIKEIMSLRLVNTFYAILSYFPQSNKKEKQQIISLLNNNKKILKYAKNIRHKLFNICSYIFGFQFSLFLMDLIHDKNN